MDLSILLVHSKQFYEVQTGDPDFASTTGSWFLFLCWKSFWYRDSFMAQFTVLSTWFGVVVDDGRVCIVSNQFWHCIELYSLVWIVIDCIKVQSMHLCLCTGYYHRSAYVSVLRWCSSWVGIMPSLLSSSLLQSTSTLNTKGRSDSVSRHMYRVGQKMIPYIEPIIIF